MVHLTFQNQSRVSGRWHPVVTPDFPGLYRPALPSRQICAVFAFRTEIPTVRPSRL